jgi:hypothetical protein
MKVPETKCHGFVEMRWGHPVDYMCFIFASFDLLMNPLEAQYFADDDRLTKLLRFYWVFLSIKLFPRKVERRWQPLCDII